MDWTIKILYGVVGLLALAIVCAMYVNVTSESFSLVKSEWACSESHTSSVPMMAGKAVVIQSRKVCDVYVRNK